MKVSDSSIMMYVSNLGQDSHLGKEHTRSVPASTTKFDNDSGSILAPVNDVVNLTTSYKPTEDQLKGLTTESKSVSSENDNSSKSTEAIIQLFEMLTGIRVGMLKQSDLTDGSAVKNKIHLLREEIVKQSQESVKKTEDYNKISDSGMVNSSENEIDSSSGVVLNLEMTIDGKAVTNGGTSIQFGNISRGTNGINLIGELRDNGNIRQVNLNIKTMEQTEKPTGKNQGNNAQPNGAKSTLGQHELKSRWQDKFTYR